MLVAPSSLACVGPCLSTLDFSASAIADTLIACCSPGEAACSASQRESDALHVG
jgi:hypothetical protein